MVVTCEAYQKRGASDEDVQEMLKSFANQYGGVYRRNAHQSDKNAVLEKAANVLFKDDEEKIKKIVCSFDQTKSYPDKKLSSSSKGGRTTEVLNPTPPTVKIGQEQDVDSREINKRVDSGGGGQGMDKTFGESTTFTKLINSGKPGSTPGRRNSGKFPDGGTDGGKYFGR